MCRILSTICVIVSITVAAFSDTSSTDSATDRVCGQAVESSRAMPEAVKSSSIPTRTTTTFLQTLTLSNFRDLV